MTPHHAELGQANNLLLLWQTENTGGRDYRVKKCGDITQKIVMRHMAPVLPCDTKDALEVYSDTEKRRKNKDIESYLPGIIKEPQPA